LGIVWWSASENQLLDSGNLLAVIVLLELDKLGLYIFQKRVVFGTLELIEQFFCPMVRSCW
jgi:hypothetical protein